VDLPAARLQGFEGAGHGSQDDCPYSGKTKTGIRATHRTRNERLLGIVITFSAAGHFASPRWPRLEKNPDLGPCPYVNGAPWTEAEFLSEPVRFPATLHYGADAYNLGALRLYSLRAVAAGVLIASCSSPVCRPGLVEQTGRCVAGDEIPKPCEPACSPAAHELCDGDIESPSCICAPGYSGIPCTWTGVLNDPGFQDQGAWTLSRGATVLESQRDTSIDDGFARVERSAACDAGAVSQTMQMPTYEVGEPLVAEVTYRAQDLYGLALSFNRSQTEFGPTSDNAWRVKERVCLGESAYGGDVTVQLSAPEQHPSCFSVEEGQLDVDRLDIVPAEPGECPAPGEVLNGTGDIGGGWQFETEGAGIAELAEGVGREGTPGVRLAIEAGDRAVAWTKASVPSPESLQSPALRFWWRGTSGLPFKFQIGRYDTVGSETGALPLDDVYGNGSDVNYLYCLPPWTHGNVVDLIFRPLLDSSSTDGPSELVIDDVEIISEARCGTSTDLLDPGFDAGPSRIMGVKNFTPYTAAILRTEPLLSRTGDGGVLELSYSNEGALMFVETWVFVPESNENEGPAIVFWSKVPADDDSINELPIRSVKGRAAVDPDDLQVGGGWVRNRRCLFPEWSGRWFRFQWRLGNFPPIGDAPIDPPIRIYIDDLELTTDTACRSE